MSTSASTLIPWRMDGTTTLRGLEDNLPYIRVCADTANPGLHRQIALVSAWDAEGEGYAHAIAALPKLLAACQAVVARWEHGDLAEAARQCAEAVKMAIPDATAVQAEQIVLSRKTRSVEYYRLADALDKIVADMGNGKVEPAKLQRKLQRICGKLRKCLPPAVPALGTFEIIDG